jgi:transcriptional regulator with XRE-family HTH domain
MPMSALEQLAQEVKRRRRALGIRTTAGLAERMKVSSRVLGDIENARRSVSTETYAALEAALGWSEGSVEAIFSGGDPQLAPVQDRWPGARWEDGEFGFPQWPVAHELLKRWVDDPKGARPPTAALLLWDFDQLLEAARQHYRDAQTSAQAFVQVAVGGSAQDEEQLQAGVLSDPPSRTDLAVAADVQEQPITGEQESHHEP